MNSISGVLKKKIHGQRIVLVDDSIVRGNTMRTLVKMLRDAGAKEVLPLLLKIMIFHLINREKGLDTSKNFQLPYNASNSPFLQIFPIHIFVVKLCI